MVKKTKKPGKTPKHELEDEDELVEEEHEAEHVEHEAARPTPEPLTGTTTFAQAMTTLNVTKKQLLLLMKNPEFPAETGGGPNSDAVTFDTTAITNFATTLHNAKANGYLLTESNLATADINGMAAAVPGRQYKRTFGDPIDQVLVEGFIQVVGP